MSRRTRGWCRARRQILFRYGSVFELKLRGVQSCLPLMKPLPGQSEREWVLLGMAESCAEKGYEVTNVADVCAAAGVSEPRFRALFTDKEECLGATMEWLVELAWRKLE